MLFCACILSVRVCPCFILFNFYSIDSCNFYFSEYKKKKKKNASRQSTEESKLLRKNVRGKKKSKNDINSEKDGTLYSAEEF